MKKPESYSMQFASIFLFETNALAYIDPSVMTYGIQVVAGLVIAVGATIGIVWRNAKKKAKKVLNIDDNTKKEVEDDVVEINPESDANE